MASVKKSSNARDTSTKATTAGKRGPFSYAICISNVDYPASLELHKIYRVLHDADAEADGDLRIIDESGEDYLYPADYFLPLVLPLPQMRELKRSFAS